jgi:anti-sigma regulatory factor (Ser/Thr protein kinase)
VLDLLTLSTSPHPMPSPIPPDRDALELALPARPENVSMIRRAVAAFAENAGLDEDAVADVSLAISEACANVVVHARRPGDDAPETTLTVRATVTQDRLQLVIADDGLGLAPRTDSPGLGLGLPLMASLSSSLELREADGGGTEVWMAFALEPMGPPIPFGPTA